MKLTDRQKRQILFVVYILVVLKVIVFKYPLARLMEITNSWSSDVVWEGLDTANFTLFKTIHMYIDYSDVLNSFENLAGNILVFVPFGIFLPAIWQKCKNFADTFLAGLVFSLAIETFQLFSAFGEFDIDDILLNCFGVVVGFILYYLFRTAKQLLQS